MMDNLSVLLRIASKVQQRFAPIFFRDPEDRKMDLGLKVARPDTIDEAIQTLVLAELGHQSEGWGVVSEEGTIKEGDGKEVLYLDPLDGTYNALNDIPFFSTSMAVFDGQLNEVTHAVVLNIPSGRIYQGVRGSGSYMGRTRLRTRRRPLKEAALSVYLGKDGVESLGDIPRRIGRCRYLGCDSLEMCLVAEGSLDGTIHLGRVPRKTDVAASLLIVKEAGGEVLSMDNDGNLGPCSINAPWDRVAGIVSFGDPSLARRLFPRGIANVEPGKEKGDGP